MRILGVIDSFTFGGAETQLAQMLAFLTVERSHQCLACSILPQQDAEVTLDARVPRIYLGKTSRRSLLRVTRDLVRLVRRFDPDVVYSRLPMANGLSRIATWLTHRTIRHVAGIDTVPAMFTTSYTRTHPGSAVFRQLERHATCIVCNSHGTARAVVDAGYPADRIRVVPNGVDVNRLSPLDQRPEPRRPQLLCIASLRPEKGVERLILTLAPLLRVHQVDLQIVGDGAERNRIDRTIAQLGVGHAVQLLGARRDVLPVLHASDLYVSAASVEGFGIAVAEAAATGIPAVAFAVPGGLSEVIIDQVTGFLIPDGDAAPFQAAVKRLCEDVGLRTRMGVAARAHVTESFALPRAAADLERYLRAE